MPIACASSSDVSGAGNAHTRERADAGDQNRVEHEVEQTSPAS